MSEFTSTLQAFFSERLIGQRHASPHIVAAHRDAFRLLLSYVAERGGPSPAQLDFRDLNAATIGEFLSHLERDRGVSVATRNARLAAVHSLFRFAAYRHPEHTELITRVLVIPAKRGERVSVAMRKYPLVAN